MSEDLHHIDQLFRKALEGEEEAPPTNVWENIDQQLDKAKVVSLTKKYATLKRVAVALLAFAFALGMYALQITYVHKQTENSTKKTDDSSTATGHKKVQQDERSYVPNAPVDTARIIEEEKASTTEAAVNSAVQQTADSSAATTKNETVTTSLATEEAVRPKNNKSSLSAIISNPIPNPVYVTKTDERLMATPKQHKYHQAKAASVGEATPRFVMEPVQKITSSGMDYQQLFQPSFSTLTSFADVSKNKKNGKQLEGKQPFSLSIFFLPALAINHITSEEPFSQRDRFRDEFEKNEQYSTTLTTGIIGNYDLNEKWSVSSGLLYSTSTINIAPKTIFAQHDREGRVRYRYNCSSGYLYIDPKQGNTPTVGDSIKALASKSMLQYVDVPTIVKYNMGKGRFIFSPTFGISANFLTKGKVETALGNSSNPEKTTVNSINGLKSLYFSGLAGFGAEYKLTNTLNIGIAPTTRFALTSINKDVLVKSYPKSFGVAASVRIRF